MQNNHFEQNMKNKIIKEGRRSMKATPHDPATQLEPRQGTKQDTKQKQGKTQTG
jgi:hypothetical protein